MRPSYEVFFPQGRYNESEEWSTNTCTVSSDCPPRFSCIDPSSLIEVSGLKIGYCDCYTVMGSSGDDCMDLASPHSFLVPLSTSPSIIFSCYALYKTLKLLWLLYSVGEVSE